jgi:hypothetical protein
LLKEREEQLDQRFKLEPENFLDQAWALINSAGERVLRPQTETEYLVSQGGGREALANALGHRDRGQLILFRRLCDPKRKKGDSETINRIEWTVYRSERGFDDLFWDYWRDIGEKWKRGDQEVGTVQVLDTQGKPRRVNLYTEAERKGACKNRSQ